MKTVAQKGNHLKVTPAAPITPLVRPFQRFAETEASGGILLLACCVIALVWANSPWADAYDAVWHTRATISVSDRTVGSDLHFFVNDGLMAIFFFVVGLEIKRELLVGELRQLSQAALPIAGALGGVLIPALIYLWFNPTGPASQGWGVPMATDIAFVIGFMALLGDRVPLGLKVFLTALAIVDDIAAVLVIGIFYTEQIAWSGLMLAGACLLTQILFNRLGVRHPLPYGLVGILLWLGVLSSGVHATIAGVVAAMAIPSRTELDAKQFLAHSNYILEYFARTANKLKGPMTDSDQQIAIDALEDACEKAQPPLHRLETFLHPWVTFFIMPVFALANAGVEVAGSIGQYLTQPVVLGVALGLALGKPLGIGLASWLAVKSGLATLPEGVTWNHVHGAAWLGGIGFTMSLFIAGLAFPEAELMSRAKMGVLAGSALAALVGSAVLFLGSKSPVGSAAEPARN